VRFSDSRRALVSVVVLLWLLYSVVGAGVVAGAVGQDSGGASPAVAQETATPTNNTTQQENPDEVNEEGDTDAVRSYLAKKLADRLGESSTKISQGQYEQGESLLGDEYDALLDKYVDVEGESGDGSGSDSFEQASENQQEYSNAVQEYNETYQEYTEAKEDGDEARARELARKLNRLEDRVTESNRNVTRSYTELENATGSDLSEARSTISNTTRQVQEQQDEVVSETFVRTNLSVRSNVSTFSFENPATFTGQLTRENGTPVQNETVRIRLGGIARSVKTDGEGRFSLTYRPVRLSRATESISVVYEPADRSVYLGSNASLSLDVTPVTADLTVSTDVRTATFGDGVSISGRASANGTPVPGARVRVTLGGEPVGTAVTGPNGTYQLTVSLPKSVPAGEATIQSVIVPSDAAVRSNAAKAAIQVEETNVVLTVNVTQQSGSTVTLSGSLKTADGRAVAGESVELRLDGTTVATVTTRADGTFERSVSLEDSLSGTVTVRAIYDQPSTNLAKATAQTQFERTRGQDDTPTDAGVPPLSPELLGGGGLLLLSLLLIGWLVRRGGEEPVPDQPPAPADSPAMTNTDVETSIVVQAASLLTAGDSEAAIRTLYAAVRNAIGGEDASSRTHWEFYTGVSESLDTEAAGTLERLTEAYERAVYSPESLDAEAAERLLEESQRLVEGVEVQNAD